MKISLFPRLNKSTSILFGFSLLMVLFLSTSLSFAAQKTWEGDVSSDWNDRNNWDRNQLPRAGDRVEVDPTVFNYTFAPIISTNSTFVPDRLEVNNGGILTIRANLTTDDRVRVDGNSITTPVLNMEGGTLTIRNNRRLELRDGGIINFTGGTINCEGDLRIDGGTFNMDQSTGVSILNVDSDNDGNGMMRIRPRNGTSSLFNMDAGTTTIGELIEIDGNGIGGSVNATIDISGGTFTNNGITMFLDIETDSTLINISGGNVTLVGDVADDPGAGGKIDFTVSGGNLIFQGNLAMEAGDNFQQSGGNIQFEGGNRMWTNDGVFNATGGAVTFNDPVSTQLFEAGGGGTWNFNNVVINGGMTMDQMSPANINVAGNWTNNAGIYNANGNKVTLNGTGLQTITSPGGETFFDLTVNNSGSGIALSNNVLVFSTLTMTQGIVNAGASKLTLGTSTANVGTFAHTSGWVVGQFERWINGASIGIDILFTVGSVTDDNLTTVNFTNLTGGSLIVEFIATDPGASGLPLSESGYNITNQFTEGYWAVTAANGLASTNYNLTLKGGGFASYGIGPITRLIKRANGVSPWTLDGIHVAGSQLDTTAARNNLNGITAQFGFGVTDCSFPANSVIEGADSACKSSSRTYYVNYSAPNTYAWTLFGGGTINPVPGPTDTSINIDWGSVEGNYLLRVSESVPCGNMKIIQKSVSIHPLSTSAITGNSNVCPNSINTYSVIQTPGYTYNWTITGGVQTGGGNTNSITVAWSGGGTGQVDVLGMSGCGAADLVSLGVTLDGYGSSTVTQNNTNNIPQYSVDAEIIGIQLVVTSNCNDTVKQFNLNTDGGNGTGSTNPTTDISAAKIYYTGTASGFATTTLFGSVNNPNGSFSITGAQALQKGTHYFWLTYDLPLNATVSNSIDGRLDSLYYQGDWKKDMAISAPVGFRSIVAATSYYSRFTGNWNRNNIWSNTDNGASCGCEPNNSGVVIIDTGHTIRANKNRTVDHILIQNGARLNGGGGRLDVNESFKTEGSGYFSLNNRLTVVGATTLRGTGASTTSDRLTFDGNLDVGAGTSLTQTRNQDIRIRGSLTVDGTMTNQGNRDFRVDGNGATSISGTGNINATDPGSEFQIRNGNKTILAGSNLTIQPYFRMRGAVTVANYGTVTLQGTGINTQGDLNGDNPASTWTNGANATLNYGGAVTMFSNAGVLNASASGNTINYNRNGNQTVILPSGSQYHHLSLSTGGTKSLAGAIDINGNDSIKVGVIFNAANNNVTLAGNWVNDGVYSAGTNTTTFDGTTTVSGLSTTIFNHMTITGVLTGHATRMDLTGLWSNSGTYNHNDGDLGFVGTTAQTITGATSFGSLTVNNGAGVSVVSGNQDLKKTLTLTSGNFATNNALTILSDGSGNTGNIAAITGGSISGDITMQRYLSGAEGWRMLGCAVNGATFSQWDNGGPVTGFGFLITGMIGNAYSGSSPNVYNYNEALLDIKDTGYVVPPNLADPIVVGSGYFDYIYGADLPTIVEVTGPANTGNYSYPVSYSNSGLPDDDGWVMVSNIYPSAIDWDAPAGWTRTNIGSAYYVWNRALQQYGSYLLGGPGTNGATAFIPSSQAFWVKATAAGPVFSCAETVKSNQDPAFAQAKNNFADMLKIQLTGAGYYDESIVRFMNSATTNFDKGYDAYKLSTFDWGPPTLSTLGTDTTWLSINAYPELSQDHSIPMDVTVQTNGTYTLSLGDIYTLPMSTWLFLEDLELATLTNLKEDSSYTFAITTTPPSSNPRFVLHFTAPLSIELTDVSCNGQDDGKAVIEKQGTGPWDFVWVDDLGDTIQMTNNINGPDSMAGLANGFYSVFVIDDSSNIYEDTFSINKLPLVVSTFTSDVDTTYISEGGMVNFTNSSTGASIYTWDFGDGSPLSTIFEPSHQYTSVGTYVSSLIASNGSCKDTTYKIIRVLQANGIEDNEPAMHIDYFNVYNVDGGIMVEINLPDNTDFDISVYNILGQKVEYLISKSSAAQNKYKLSLPKDGEGIYFVHFNTKDAQFIRKVTFIE